MNRAKKQHAAAPLTVRGAGHAQHMQLLVGRRPIRLPSQQCDADNVRRAVERINPPFVVMGSPGKEGRFAVRRRVFFETEGVRAECENDGELGLACKLMAESHNQWQEGDHQTRACIEETSRMELAAEKARAQADSSEGGEDEAQSEEDISIEEWGQMGYKWFRREDVTYI